MHLPDDIQFVSIGHFVHDVAEEGFILGGAAAYSSIAARGLGLRTGVISAVGEDFLYHDRFDGISLSLIDPARSGSTGTTTYHNIYTNGVRSQIVRNVAATIHPEHIPSGWLDAEIVYLCPVADEVDPAIVHMFPNSIIGVSPQGWMREWDDQGRVSQRRWKDATKVLPHVDAVIMSEEDIAPFPDVVDEYVDLAEIVVLTRGARGSTLFYNGQSTDFSAFPTYTVDPTGAGDVFAVAFLREFHRTRDLNKASVFANCTASFVVEAEGIEGIPELGSVQARLEFRKI